MLCPPLEKELEITQAVAQLDSCTIRRNCVQAAYSTVAPDNNYRYNGKERNGDYGIGLHDYGARWYDAAIGRFTTTDPVAESYSFQTAYAYAANNPVSNIDYMGMAAESVLDLVQQAWDSTPEDGSAKFDNDGNRIEEDEGQEECCKERYFDMMRVMGRAADSGGNPREAWNQFLEDTNDTKIGEAAKDAIIIVGSGYLIGGTVGLILKVGGRYVMVAAGAKNASKGVQLLTKALKPIDKLDEVKLYRGLSGSENSGSVIFFTDDPVVAATYTKNGGKVVEVTLSKVQLKRLEFADKLHKLTGIHETTGKISTEYKFIGTELKRAIMNLAK